MLVALVLTLQCHTLQLMPMGNLGPPLIEDGFANATIPQLNMYGNSSVPSIPHIRGGYTSFLLGVDQAATLQAAAKKLNFD